VSGANFGNLGRLAEPVLRISIKPPLKGIWLEETRLYIIKAAMAMPHIIKKRI
jgi:hypothetical protein